MRSFGPCAGPFPAWPLACLSIMTASVPASAERGIYDMGCKWHYPARPCASLVCTIYCMYRMLCLLRRRCSTTAHPLGMRCGSMTAGVLGMRMAASTMSMPPTPSGCAVCAQQHLQRLSRKTRWHACNAGPVEQTPALITPSAHNELAARPAPTLCRSLQGRALAFWKREVVDMMRDACEMWLGPEYGADGLRFDSANDFPKETVQARLQSHSCTCMRGIYVQSERAVDKLMCVQAMTWAIREKFPGRILTAEVRRLLHFTLVIMPAALG